MLAQKSREEDPSPLNLGAQPVQPLCSRFLGHACLVRLSLLGVISTLPVIPGPAWAAGNAGPVCSSWGDSISFQPHGAGGSGIMRYRSVWSALQGTTSTEWILVGGSLLTWIVTLP